MNLRSFPAKSYLIFYQPEDSDGLVPVFTGHVVEAIVVRNAGLRVAKSRHAFNAGSDE